MIEVTKEQFAKGTFWKVIERIASRGVSLVISMVLARLLTPDDYGLIALTVVFTNLSDILIDAGFSTALIRKDKVDEEDYSSIFTISCIISAVLYLVFFFVAPFVADYYEKEKLVPLLRVMSIVLFIQAFSSTRNAYINRNMQFKLLMKCTTLSSILSGLLGIVAAYIGLGVWALVIQRLMQQFILTVTLFIKIKWRPKFVINFSKLKEMFKFSSGVIGASIINYLENCINSTLIGKYYSVADLGYYDKGNTLPEQVSLNLFSAMTNVLLPTISSFQKEIDKVKRTIRKITRYSYFILIPMMLGMCMVSKEAITIFFSDAWLPAVPMMRCICIYYIATPLMLIDIQVFFALGYSSIRVKTEIIRLVLLLIGIVVSCFIIKGSIIVLAIANATAVCVATVFTNIEVKKLIGYNFMERLQDIYKPVLATAVMCIGIYGFTLIANSFSINIILLLSIKIIVGGFLYIIMCWLLKLDTLREIIQMVKGKLKK